MCFSCVIFFFSILFIIVVIVFFFFSSVGSVILSRIYTHPFRARSIVFVAHSVSSLLVVNFRRCKRCCCQFRLCYCVHTFTVLCVFFRIARFKSCVFFSLPYLFHRSGFSLHCWRFFSVFYLSIFLNSLPWQLLIHLFGLVCDNFILFHPIQFKKPPPAPSRHKQSESVFSCRNIGYNGLCA